MIDNGEQLLNGYDYQKKRIPMPIFLLAASLLILGVFGSFMAIWAILGILTTPLLIFVFLPILGVVTLSAFAIRIGNDLRKMKKWTLYGYSIIFIASLFLIYFLDTNNLSTFKIVVYYTIPTFFIIPGPIILWIYRKQFK